MDNKILEAGNEGIRAALNWVGDGQPARGLAEIERILQDRPTSASAHHVKGMALAALMRYPEAIQSMREAIARSTGDDPAYFFDLGTSLLELGSPSESYDAFKRSVRAAVLSGNTYYLQPALLLKAVAAFKDGKREAAREDLAALEDETSSYCAGELWSKDTLLQHLG